jgi:exonuclease VII large subunit
LVRDAKARPVTSADALKPGTDLTLKFHDGEAAAVVAGKKTGGKTLAPDKGSGEQGSLL